MTSLVIVKADVIKHIRARLFIAPVVGQSNGTSRNGTTTGLACLRQQREQSLRYGPIENISQQADPAHELPSATQK